MTLHGLYCIEWESLQYVTKERKLVQFLESNALAVCITNYHITSTYF